MISSQGRILVGSHNFFLIRDAGVNPLAEKSKQTKKQKPTFYFSTLIYLIILTIQVFTISVLDKCFSPHLAVLLKKSISFA